MTPGSIKCLSKHIKNKKNGFLVILLFLNYQAEHLRYDNLRQLSKATWMGL